MGTFRALSASDASDLLSRFAVGAYRGHTAISAGTVNTNLAVDAADGRYFLRINEGKSREDVEREAAIVSHLAARGVPAPAPLRSRDGQPFVLWSDVFASLFPWVEGRTLARHELSPRHARAAGQALAGLHLAGADFPDRSPGRYEPDEIQRRFDRVAREAADDQAVRDALVVLGPELAALSRERSLAAASLPMGVIHGDLFVDNVLFGSSGTLASLIDFEQASWGRLVYDLAVAFLAFGFGRDDFHADNARAFLDGYAAKRTPTAAERASFPAELRFACCRFAVTRLTDVHLRRDRGAPAGKDFRRYLLRLARVHERLAAGDELLALP